MYVKLASFSHVDWDPDRFDSHRPALYHDATLTPILPRFLRFAKAIHADLKRTLPQSAKATQKSEVGDSPLLGVRRKPWNSLGDPPRPPTTLKEASLWKRRLTPSELCHGPYTFEGGVGFVRRSRSQSDVSSCAGVPLFV